MRASVVIPTFNRLSALQRVTAAVASQAVPPGTEIEVIVVDDGSDDGTWPWMRRVGDKRGWTVLNQPNSGPATARNRGVRSATGDIVLFLGDDTVPQRGWLMAHLEEHRLFGGREPLAVLGHTAFPSDGDSPFMRFINEYGAQFGYSIIEDPRTVPFNFFYTSNVSLPRDELIRHGGFREDFPAAAWEDIEFAYRAQRAGLRMCYQPRARAIHEHCVRPRTFCRRQRTSGLSAAIFQGIHPELTGFLGVESARKPEPFRGLKRLCLLGLLELGERVDGLVPQAAYRQFLDLCYRDGLAEGLHSS
jgi:glycosyltransferase involved in cell wall biosynthesis